MKLLVFAACVAVALASGYEDKDKGYEVKQTVTREYKIDNDGYGAGYGNDEYRKDTYNRQASYNDGYGYGDDKKVEETVTREYKRDNDGYGYGDDSYGKETYTREVSYDNDGYEKPGYGNRRGYGAGYGDRRGNRGYGSNSYGYGGDYGYGRGGRGYGTRGYGSRRNSYV